MNWTETRRSIPATEVPGVPDAATVWAAWMLVDETVEQGPERVQAAMTAYRTPDGTFYLLTHKDGKLRGYQEYGDYEELEPDATKLRAETVRRKRTRTQHADAEA